MKAIDVLTRDHERIKALLDLIRDAMRELETAPRPDVATWRHLLEMCEQWVDRVHVLKEEQGLFPILRSRGLGPEVTVVAALISQHQTGQAFLRELGRALQRLAAGDEGLARARARAGDAAGARQAYEASEGRAKDAEAQYQAILESARHDVIVWARDYVELLREHMRIEDHYFYELADGSLSAADDAALVERFARIDRTVGGSEEDRRRWAAMIAGTTAAGRTH